MKLRVHLTALSIGAMAPLVVVVVVAGALLVRHERETIEREAIGRTRAAMTAIDAVLGGVISSMDALASSSQLKAGNLRAFHEEARRIMASQPYWLNVGLVSASQGPVFDAVRPFGDPVVSIGDVETLDAVLKTGRLVIGNVEVGTAIGVPAVRIRMPIVQDGAVRYVLSVPLKFGLFDDVLRAQELPPGWVIVVVDRNQRFVARIPRRPPGDPISPSFREALARAPEGFFRGTTVEGFETYTPYVTSSLSGWVVGIAVPSSLVNAGVYRAGVTVAVGLALALGAGWILAWLMAKQIARPIGALAAAAKGHGPDVRTLAPGNIDEIGELHTAFRERTEALEFANALSEKAQAITDVIISDLPLNRLLQEVLRRTVALLQVDTAVVLLLQEEQEGEDQLLRVHASIGMEKEVEARMTIPIGHGFAGTVARERRPVVWNELDPSRLVSPILAVKGLRSLAGVPLLTEGGLLGVLHVGSLTPRTFGGADVKLLELAAERLSLGLERVARYDAERRHREAAEETNRIKDTFLAILSHELRTPLTTVVGWLRIMRTSRLDSAQQARGLETAERNALALARMIEDLLDVSRIAAGKMALDRAPVSLGPLVTDVVESFHQQARDRGVTLETHVELDVVTVMGDGLRLDQVLRNLVGNALKFTPAGGRVDVGVVRKPDAVQLLVEDTGMGIAADVLPHVFERFRQATVEPAGTQRGLGLGLAIVRQIVTLHGGTVEVHSDGIGRGSTFTVTLPLYWRRSE